MFDNVRPVASRLKRLLHLHSMSTAAQMLWALILGIALGLFFGEQLAWMQLIGNAMILLMQMTVFPYIVVSLIAGIGKLDKSSASLLFREAGAILLFLWGLGLIVVFAMLWTLPEFESASFFKPSSVEAPAQIDYFKLYIPSNPFASMADGAVPAMVVFSLSLGFALMNITDKAKVLDFMSVATQALSRVTQALVKVLPIGVLCMAASAAGTMSLQEFASLQVYLILVVVLCLLLSFWILPWLIASLCPASFREVLRISRAAMITAFATGNVLIVLPVMIEECKALLAERGELEDEDLNIIDILVPIAFSFPSIGKISVMIFVVFAAWFAGKPLALSDVPSLAVGGLFSLFGSVYVAVPFMLNLSQLAQELFQYFVMSGFITGRFTSVMTVMHLFAFTLLSASAYKHLLKLDILTGLRVFSGLAVGLMLTLMLVKAGLSQLELESDTSEVIANMRVAEAVPKHVIRQPSIQASTGHSSVLADIATIQQRGVLRVGYRPSYVPFSYYNNAGELVGFDIALMEDLANDLDVAVEFIAYDQQRIPQGLDSGHYDIAISAIAVNVQNMQRLSFTDAVLELTLALAIADHRVNEVNSLEKIKAVDQLTVAYVENFGRVAKAKTLLPNVDFVAIDSYKQFYKDKQAKYDALLISAEAGAAWSLFYPHYDVAIFDRLRRYPASFAVAADNQHLLRFMNNWLALKKVDGSLDKHYRYWILGQGAANKKPRWSIKRDILGW